MNELRNTLLSVDVARTGTLVATRVVDLEALPVNEAGTVSLEELKTAGSIEVTLELPRGKATRLWTGESEGEARAFVTGFVACAKARKKRAAPKAKRAPAEAPPPPTVENPGAAS